MNKKSNPYRIPFLPASECPEDKREQLSLRVGVADQDTRRHDTDGDAQEKELRLMEGRGYEAKAKGADPQRDFAVPSIDAESVSTTEWDVWGESDWRDSWS